MEVLESIYKWEIVQLHNLQQLPLFASPFWSKFWLSSTKFGDPAWTFLVYFPILYPLAKDVALQFVLAGAVSEFTNGVLKWILHGERPFWYVYEHNLHKTIPLTQFEYTCETGPGSPSGHVMVTSCIFYVLLAARKTKSDRTKAWIILILLLILVSVSRLYIAAHFPHQVVLGVAAGFIIGHLASRVHPVHWGLGRPLLVATLLSLFGLVTYLVMLWTGFDPNWSIAKAMRWCQHSEWIHLSTHPMSALFRDIGALLGLGINLRLIHGQVDGYRNRRTPNPLYSLISVCTVQLVYRLVPIPSDPVWVFYTATLFLHIALSHIVMVVLPKLYEFISDKSCSRPKAE